MIWPFIVPILDFLGLFVLELGRGMRQTDRQTRQTPAIMASVHDAPHYGGRGHNNQWLLPTLTSCTRRMAIANGTCVSFCNQPKAHFGLLWVRLWDNRGKCHMDEKRIQYLLKHRSMYPASINSFSVIQPVSSKVRHFSTFWLPGSPGTIAVNVTLVERGFNAGQTHSSMYPSIFNRLRAIERYWSEIVTFSYLPLHLTSPLGCSH